MTELIKIHPVDPQRRLIQRIAVSLGKSQLVVLPTDSGYSLCCKIGCKEAIQQICRICQPNERHFFTLLCRDFSEISRYASLNNSAFRFLKAHTPAPLIAILPATKAAPKSLVQPKKKTIEISVPQNPIINHILVAVAEPLVSVSVDQCCEGWPLLDPFAISEFYRGRVSQVVDGGLLAAEQTTLVDLSGEFPEILRQGAYRISPS